MSNVKTGDLAWLVSHTMPYPVCEVGKQLTSYDYYIVSSTGKEFHSTADVRLLHWWCFFTRPVWYGHWDGADVYCQLFPVWDKYLKKISGSQVLNPAREYGEQLFNTAPLNAEERAILREQKV